MPAVLTNPETRPTPTAESRWWLLALTAGLITASPRRPRRTRRSTAMADPTTELVKHKLQVHFDPHECQPTDRELAAMADDTDSLARQVGNFPQADLRVLIERNARSDEYTVKLRLL